MDRRFRKPARRTLLLLVLGWWSIGIAAAADDAYHFELIVFERPGVSGVDAPGIDPPALDDSGAEGRVVGRLDTLPSGDEGLGAVAYTLQRKGMSVVLHRAWIQVPRALDSDTWYEVDNGRLGGRLRLTRGRFLHLDAELRLAGATPDDDYRARFDRRMRSDELHYVDNPRLGLLIKATRVQNTTGPAGGDSAGAGEPRPAEPDAAR